MESAEFDPTDEPDDLDELDGEDEAADAAPEDFEDDPARNPDDPELRAIQGG